MWQGLHDTKGDLRLKGRRLADLRHQAAVLERELSDARVLLERELTRPAGDGLPRPPAGDPASPDDQRTEVLVRHGRRSAYHRGISRAGKTSIGVALAGALAAAGTLALLGGSASWPPSVARVSAEAATACQNPDVSSEPGQVNFACARGTRQILWVFALLTSGGNARFADPRTGRVGLLPIAPAQGGAVALSLNLHHPYQPTNPVDSLAVAARAINDIIGGATVTGPRGTPVVQPGLESDATNCLRYTGSASVRSRAGYPPLCARPADGLAGQAALVADVYQKWMVGAPPAEAQDAATLFSNATNPGDQRVQAILRHLPASGGAS